MPVDVDLPLIDHHCHSLVPRNLTRRAFEKLMRCGISSRSPVRSPACQTG